MVGPSELKRLWRNYREHRATKKKSRQASSESSSRDSKDSMALDEASIMIVGTGLDSKEEDYEEYDGFILDDDDPRFINNPHGIGCSRTYETPYDSVSNSRSPSPASVRPLVPQEPEPNEGDRLLPFPNLGPWKPEGIDMVKGKRKGRMPGDSADDRYKFLLDGPASRSKFSAKRFSLERVRQRAWTR